MNFDLMAVVTGVGEGHITPDEGDSLLAAGVLQQQQQLCPVTGEPIVWHDLVLVQLYRPDPREAAMGTGAYTWQAVGGYSPSYFDSPDVVKEADRLLTLQYGPEDWRWQSTLPIFEKLQHAGVL